MRRNQLVDPDEVRLGRRQPQLGLVAAHMEPRDARRFFEQLAPFDRSRGDDRANPALADKRGRVRAGRGVGKQQRDVARPDVTPIDPVRRAEPAFDPADDLHRRASGGVERERHLGKVASGSRRGPGEDHVVHRARAQRLRRALAHNPAKRLEQVRLAAAVRPDHAGQSRPDPQLGCFDERLEPAEP